MDSAGSNINDRYGSILRTRTAGHVRCNRVALVVTTRIDDFIAPGCWKFRVIAELTRSRLITNLLARIPGGLLSGAEPDFAPGL